LQFLLFEHFVEHGELIWVCQRRCWFWHWFEV